MEVMSNAVRELLSCVMAAEDVQELVAYVKHWVDLCEHGLDEMVCYLPVGITSRPRNRDQRRQIAIKQVKREGFVTSGTLAKLAGVSSESCRIDLVRLALDGHLQRRGLGRGAYYAFPEHGGNGSE